MKITYLRLMALALVAAVVMFVAPSSASAAYVGIQVGGPPPPYAGRVDQPWARPYPGAVWIAPHNEWVNGRWVYIRGYYAYPPRRGAVYVPSRYRHGYYYPGHWNY